MALPELTAEDRAAALDRAKAARRRRAECRRSIKSGQMALSDVFTKAEKDDAIAKMRARALLESLPRVGAYRATVLMEEIGISPTRRVRGLGRAQREELIRRFG